MSIITEALKKVQQTREEKHRETESQELPPASGTDTRTQHPGDTRTSSVNRLILPAAVFGSVLLGGAIFTLLLSSHPNVPAPVKTSPAHVAETKPIQKGSTDPVPVTATKETATGESQEKNTQPPSIEQKKSFFFSRSETLPILTGIMYSPTRPQAIINGSMVTKGEVVNGYTIQDILPDRVKVSQDEKEIELRIR